MTIHFILWSTLTKNGRRYYTSPISYNAPDEAARAAARLIREVPSQNQRFEKIIDVIVNQ